MGQSRAASLLVRLGCLGYLVCGGLLSSFLPCQPELSRLLLCSFCPSLQRGLCESRLAAAPRSVPRAAPAARGGGGGAASLPRCRDQPLPLLRGTHCVRVCQGTGASQRESEFRRPQLAMRRPRGSAALGAPPRGGVGSLLARQQVAHHLQAWHVLSQAVKSGGLGSVREYVTCPGGAPPSRDLLARLPARPPMLQAHVPLAVRLPTLGGAWGARGLGQPRRRQLASALYVAASRPAGQAGGWAACIALPALVRPC